MKIDDKILSYCKKYSSPDEEILNELSEFTFENMEAPNMISGNITPQQAKDLTAVLEVQRKMPETVGLRPIFEEIKEHMKNRGY